MMAAYILERGLLVLSKTAALSSIRYINGGPQNLLWLFWGRTGFERKFSTGLLVFALLSTTVVTQLTSTALLSDLKTDFVPGTPQSNRLVFRLNETYSTVTSRTAGAEELWSNKPPFYLMFAEYSELPTQNVDDGVSDTGMTLRAFLPFPEEQRRTLIRNYTGPATVFDSRVTCIQPTVN